MRFFAWAQRLDINIINKLYGGKNMFLNNFKLEPKIHLRYIIQIAISIEEQGVEYYSKLAEKFSDINTKKLCSKLAGDEAVHKNYFRKHYCSGHICPQTIRF